MSVFISFLLLHPNTRKCIIYKDSMFTPSVVLEAGKFGVKRLLPERIFWQRRIL